MKHILEKLYTGQLFAFGERHIESKVYQQSAKQLLETAKNLRQTFPDCKDLLEQHDAQNTKLSEIVEYHQFLRGFRVGAQLMIEMPNDIS